MNKNEQHELEKTLKDIAEALKRDDLTDEQREEFSKLQASLTGRLLSSWLPSCNVRRVIMLCLFLIGLRAFINYNNIFILYWLPIALFSPRIVGNLAFFMGALSRLISKSK